MAVGLGYHFWDIPMTDYVVPFQVVSLIIVEVRCFLECTDT